MPCQTVVSRPAPSTGLKLHISTSSAENEMKQRHLWSRQSPHRIWFSPVIATCSNHFCLSCRSDLLLGPSRRLYSSTSPLQIACLRWSIIARVAWDIHGFLEHKRFPRTCSKIESTFVMTPHGFKGLILQGGGSKFWGNIRPYSWLTSILERDDRLGWSAWFEAESIS